MMTTDWRGVVASEDWTCLFFWSGPGVALIGTHGSHAGSMSMTRSAVLYLAFELRGESGEGIDLNCPNLIS